VDECKPLVSAVDDVLTLAAAMKARPMPVLPDVGSTSMVLPGAEGQVNNARVNNASRHMAAFNA